MDAVDAGVGEGFGDEGGRGLEGLGLVAGPDGEDGLAVDAVMNAVGYGFDFGEFGDGGFSCWFEYRGMGVAISACARLEGG